MALKRIHRRWTQQPPTGVGLDWSHPMTKGLVSCIVNDAELVGGAVGRMVGSSVELGAVTPLGLAAKSTGEGATGGIAYTAPPELHSITTALTIMLHLVPGAMTLSAWGQMLCVPYRAAGWSNPYSSMYLTRPANSTGIRLLFATSPTAFLTASSANGALDPAVDAGKSLTLGVARDGATAKFFRNGQQHGTNVTTSATPVDWGERRPINLWTRSDTTLGEGMRGATPIACVWSRALSAEEAAEFHRNPWQMFRPQAAWTSVSEAGPNTENPNSTITSILGAVDLQNYQDSPTTQIISGTGVTDQLIGNPALDTGLDFPGSEATTDSIRFKFVDPHLNGLPIFGPGGAGVTYVWKAFPRSQGTSINGGYYTTFFWGNDGAFIWNNGKADTFYGAHPYPEDNYSTNINTRWEIAAPTVNGGTDVLGEAVTYERWYTQVMRVWVDVDGTKRHEFYYDWPNTEKVITYTAPASVSEVNPPSPALTFGDAAWNPSKEIYSGILRGFQIYAAKLTLTEIADEIAAPQSTSVGTSSIWYLNTNPTPTDISDKSGSGHHPVWATASRPTLYQGSSAEAVEDLISTITSITSAADLQTYLEVATTLITSGASAESVQAMVEAVLSTATATGGVVDLATRVEECLTTVQSSTSVADAIAAVEDLLTIVQSSASAGDLLQAVESVQTAISSVATVADVAQLVEDLQTTIASSSAVTDTLQSGQTFAEILLTTATAAAEASAAQSFVETATALAQGTGNAAELQGYLETLTTTGQSIAQTVDRQLYYDNIAILAMSGASVAEIGAYIEQVQTAATGTGSVDAVLRGAFVGQYLFVDLARARTFLDLAHRRSFTDYARPRRTLQ